MAKESNKPFEGWTEADFAADAAARKAALAGVASQMEAELAAYAIATGKTATITHGNTTATIGNDEE